MSVTSLALFDQELRFEMCHEMCGPEPDCTEEDEDKTISEYDALQRFDDFLNECWDEVYVCGYGFPPAKALKELDPTAYREAFNNWLDSEGLELE